MSTSKILQPTGKWAKSGLAVSNRLIKLCQVWVRLEAQELRDQDLESKSWMWKANWKARSPPMSRSRDVQLAPA